MKKMMYEKPEMEVVWFETEDIITSSGDDNETPIAPGKDYEEFELFNNND